MYRIQILDAATRELMRLDKPMGRRTVERIHWLAANIELIKPEALTGKLVGFYKFRVGDYRVIYEIIDSERMIVIHAIGHRKEIYRKR